ncbi:MAG: ATP-binding cassette domain-containing protein, partial [Saezia sp.]
MNKVMLSLRQLGLRYGQLQALQNITLDVMAGERIAIIGPNGAGKSSLFDVLSGFVSPSAGEIILDGARLDHLSVQERAKAGLMRSFQRSRLFKEMSVLEHLRCAASIHSLPTLTRYAFWQGLKGNAQSEDHLQHLAQALSLPLHAQATQLSYAHQRLLELAMMLVADAKVLLLDEPAAGLDQAEV